jgi:hypothetical protein
MVILGPLQGRFSPKVPKRGIGAKIEQRPDGAVVAGLGSQHKWRIAPPVPSVHVRAPPGQLLKQPRMAAGGRCSEGGVPTPASGFQGGEALVEVQLHLATIKANPRLFSVAQGPRLFRKGTNLLLVPEAGVSHERELPLLDRHPPRLGIRRGHGRACR